MTLPGMSDGRCFTSFISNCQLNENIRVKNNKMSNNEYRMFLQENAEQIMSDFKNICGNEATKESFACWGIKSIKG